MTIFPFIRTKVQPPEEQSEFPPESVKTPYGIYQLRADDIIMTRPLFELILASIQNLPTLPRDQQEAAATKLVRELKIAVGERV